VTGRLAAARAGLGYVFSLKRHFMRCLVRAHASAGRLALEGRETAVLCEYYVAILAGDADRGRETGKRQGDGIV
jgi:hypothetical protein